MYKRVLIMMSTFNGKDTIYQQVNSILEQKNVYVHILIRDDGSDEECIQIINKIKVQNPDQIDCLFGDNIGWKQSFMELLYSASIKYDYFGFSDQDDIWMEDKLWRCIQLMEQDSINCGKLTHCNSLSVGADLKLRNEQEKRIGCPHSHKAAIAMEYFQGCGMLWNREIMEIIRMHRPINKDIAHDYWVGLIATLFGKIYFCDEPLFFHIRYQENASSDGSVWKGRKNRLKQFMRNECVYMNPTQDLIIGYKDMLCFDDLMFLKRLSVYKINYMDKAIILMDKAFKRTSLKSTLLLKITILLNRY